MFPALALTTLALSAIVSAQDFADRLIDATTAFDYAQIPESLSINFAPEIILSVAFPDANVDVGTGQQIPVPVAASGPPTFTVGFADGTADSGTTYVLIGVDPDAPANITQVRHYLAAGLTFISDDDNSTSTDDSSSSSVVATSTESATATLTSTEDTATSTVVVRKRHGGNDHSSRTVTSVAGAVTVSSDSTATGDDSSPTGTTEDGPSSTTSDAGPTSTGIPDDTSFFTLTNSTPAITEYAPPAPPVGGNAHRYIWLLYVQPANFSATTGISDPTVRFGFNVSQYAQLQGLGDPVAGTYWLTADYGFNQNATTTTSSASESATATTSEDSTVTESVSATVTSTEDRTVTSTASA